jgi:sugar-specific transcriptional regulator TrmB
MIEKDFKELGLSEKETRLYLALMQLGPSSPGVLCRRTNFARSTIYEIATSLIKKGLVLKTKKKGKTYFIPESMEILVNRHLYLSEQARRLSEQLTDLFGIKTKQVKLRYTEGIEGLKSIYEQILLSKSKKVYGFVSVKDMLEVVGEDFLKNHIRKRVERKIYWYVIRAPEGEIGIPSGQEFSVSEDQRMERTSRIGPPGMNLTGLVGMFDDKTVVASTKKEMFGMVIESKEFTDMMLGFHQIIWAISKEV